MNAIITIQATLRGYAGRTSFLKSRQAVILSQSVARSWLARRIHGEMLRRLEGQRMLSRLSTKVRKQKQALDQSENEAQEGGVEVAGMDFVVRFCLQFSFDAVRASKQLGQLRLTISEIRR